MIKWANCAAGRIRNGYFANAGWNDLCGNHTWAGKRIICISCVSLRSAVVCEFTQLETVMYCWRFGATVWPHLQGSSNERRKDNGQNSLSFIDVINLTFNASGFCQHKLIRHTFRDKYLMWKAIWTLRFFFVLLGCGNEEGDVGGYCTDKFGNPGCLEIDVRPYRQNGKGERDGETLLICWRTPPLSAPPTQRCWFRAPWL